MIRKQKADYSYINDYNKANYDRITLIVPKGARQLIRVLAMQKEVSVNEYILSCLPPQLTAAMKQISDALWDEKHKGEE